MDSLYNGTNVIELTDDDFDLSGPEVNLKGGPGLIMAYSAQCPHCINKKDTYTELSNRLNNNGGYQIYAIHTLNPETNKVCKALNVMFIPAFFEVDKNGRLSPYDGQNFSLKQVLDRSKEFANEERHSNSLPRRPRSSHLSQTKPRGIDISRLHNYTVDGPNRLAGPNRRPLRRITDSNSRDTQIGGYNDIKQGQIGGRYIRKNQIGGCGCSRQNQAGGVHSRANYIYNYNNMNKNKNITKCMGITKEGHSCSRNAMSGGAYCFQHA